MSEESISDPAVTDDEMATPITGESAEMEIVDVSDLEIPIQFGLGSLNVSVKQLNSIQAGYIFQLDTSGDQPVVIRSGGKPIGRGSLVQIGDQLGVQITEWN